MVELIVVNNCQMVTIQNTHNETNSFDKFDCSDDCDYCKRAILNSNDYAGFTKQFHEKSKISFYFKNSKRYHDTKDSKL